MKVLIVNTSEDTGGAAVAMGRLAEALSGCGVVTTMLVRDRAKGLHGPIPVRCLRWKWLQRWRFLVERLYIFIVQGFSRRNLFKIDPACTGADITTLSIFKEADIIHLHWINQGFLSLRSLRRIMESGKPVVWTMHDMWECTSLCHHAHDCRRYEEECCECPLLSHPAQYDLANKVFRRKKEIYAHAKRLHLVAVSQWLAERTQHSALTRHLSVSVIPNTISLSGFKPISREAARKALGISEPYVIALGAARIDDPIKGFAYLFEALHILNNRGTFPSDSVRVLLFGEMRNQSLLQQIPIPCTHLGFISGTERLSLIYSASNATVSSSLYETFGQTLIEAMACGSLPVSFDGSGQTDIITHLKTGYLARRLSAVSLADGITWALKSDIPAAVLRDELTARYSGSVVAKRYVSLYNHLLQNETETDVSALPTE